MRVVMLHLPTVIMPYMPVVVCACHLVRVLGVAD